MLHTEVDTHTHVIAATLTRVPLALLVRLQAGKGEPCPFEDGHVWACYPGEGRCPVPTQVAAAGASDEWGEHTEAFEWGGRRARDAAAAAHARAAAFPLE